MHTEQIKFHLFRISKIFIIVFEKIWSANMEERTLCTIAENLKSNMLSDFSGLTKNITENNQNCHRLFWCQKSLIWDQISGIPPFNTSDTLVTGMMPVLIHMIHETHNFIPHNVRIQDTRDTHNVRVLQHWFKTWSRNSNFEN